MKNITIGIQDFKELRKDDGFYLDKTKQIYDLISSNTRHYFFSRPRRFGKSILLSTLKNLFLGNKDLFKGLYIENKWNFKKTNPVIHISFSGYTSDQDLKEYIQYFGRIYIKGEERKIVDYGMFNLGYILEEIYKETKNSAVILIDEYDKPVLANLNNPPKAEEVRDFFANFYASIKDNDRYIRLFMLTGLTKLMKMSVFSVLNNLDDISFTNQYCDLIGYTQEELEKNFKEEIKKIAKEKNKTNKEQIEELKIEYNGFNFGNNELTLYNPWDINNFIAKKRLRYYWADTGVPSAIRNYIKNNSVDVQKMIEDIKNNSLAVTETELQVRDLSRIKAEVLFLNSGYLTIKKVLENRFYYLDFPNKETEIVMTEYFLSLAYVDSINIVKWKKTSNKIITSIFNKDAKELKESISYLIYDILSATPYDWLNKNPEGWFKTLLGVAMRMNSIYYWPETQNILGRIDFHIPKDGIIYILEVKINESTKKAIQQINEKYTKQYNDIYKNIVKIGVNWNREKKKVAVRIEK